MIVTRRPPSDDLNFGQLLRIAHETLIDELHSRLDEAGFGDVRPPHAPVFSHLTAAGMRLTDLAERAQLTKQMLNYLINSLEELGYVERLPDPDDRRGRIVRLTPRGVDAARASRNLVQEIEREWAARIGEGEMRYLRILLRRLVGTVAKRS